MRWRCGRSAWRRADARPLQPAVDDRLLHLARLGAIGRPVLELDHRQHALPADLLEVVALAAAQRFADLVERDVLSGQRLLDLPARVRALEPGVPAGVELD